MSKKPLKKCCGTRPLLTYDVPNDEYFVACMVCGKEGRRRKEENQAIEAWTKGLLSREKANHYVTQ